MARRALTLLALTLTAQPPDFERLYRQAFEQRERTLGAQAAKTQESAKDLALYLAARGEYAKAAEHAAPAIRLAATPTDAAVLHNWAVAIEDQHPDQAEQMYRRALAIRARALTPLDADLAITRLNLATLLINKPEPKEAQALAAAALTAFEKKLGPSDARTGAACGVLATAFAIRGDVPNAERHFRRALAIAEKAHGPDSPHTASALENLADLLSQTGRESAARPLLNRAQQIRSRTR